MARIVNKQEGSKLSLRSLAIGLTAVAVAVAVIAIRPAPAHSHPHDHDHGTAVSPLAESVLPIEAYIDRLLLDSAQHFSLEAAIGSCMLSQEFDYTIAPFAGDGLIDLDTRYGLLDASIAAELEADPNAFYAGSTKDGMNDSFEALSPEQRDAWDLAFFGDQVARVEIGDGYVERLTGGCLEAAWASTVADVDAWTEAFYRIQGLLGESYSQSESDPRVTAKLGDWQACMADESFAVSSREEMGGLSLMSDGLWTADVTCNTSVGLAQEWFRVESEVQSALLAQQAGLLDQLINQAMGGSEK